MYEGVAAIGSDQSMSFPTMMATKSSSSSSRCVAVIAPTFIVLLSLVLFLSVIIGSTMTIHIGIRSFDTVISSNTAAVPGLLWKDVCTQASVQELPFCNLSLSIDERTDDYVARIPMAAKIPMMGNTASSYEPLYIPPYQWWSEGLHGPFQACIPRTFLNGEVSSTYKCPTSFPCPSALGTAFNDSLYYRIGSAIGREGRAFSNIRSHRLTDIGDGLDYWSPVVNMQRDPRWGRNQEAPGEDPLLTSRYAIHYIQGLQQLPLDDTIVMNDDTNATTTAPVQIAACCKHFVGNSLEQWTNYSRHSFDAIISDDDLQNYYLVPFKACIQQGRALGIMCSYNAINGIPSCANEPLLKGIVREEWNFTGYITSDCGAIEDIYMYHNYTPDAVTAVARSITATTDIDCSNVYQTNLAAAVSRGLIHETIITESFTRLVRVQMQLGLFDNNKADNKYAQYGFDDIDSLEHQLLALEAARQSIVLLQNKDNTLPFQVASRGQKIAVIGPHYNATDVLLGNYHGDRCGGSFLNDNDKFNCIETPLDAIRQANVNGETYGMLGCHVSDMNWDEIDAAVELANSSDVILLMMGLDQTQETEEHDRLITSLPGLQPKLVEAVLALGNPNTVLLLFNGGSLSLGPTILSGIPAIIDVFYGGQSSSQALADVLFGRYNPTGKLAATMYPPSYVDEIPLTEMGLNVGVGRTHMYYKGIPEFAFGHGLSYTSWELSLLRQQSDNTMPSPSSSDEISLQVNVRNIGPFDGSQTVLLFRMSSNEERQMNGRRQTLVGYMGTSRVLHPGEEETLTFEISLHTFLPPMRSIEEGNDVVTLKAVTANNVYITKLIPIGIYLSSEF